MGKYIKLFETHSEYNTYINGQDAILPNVSYCEDNNEVHFNSIETRLIVRHNITNISQPTTIGNWSSYTFEDMEIDGILEENVSDTYTFDAIGEHIIKYTLKSTSLGYTFNGCSTITSIKIPDSITVIGDNTFNGCSGLTSITIPDSVTSIGQSAFQNCSGLTSITIPNNVTSIGQSAFNGCSGLTGITIGSGVTSIGNGAFRNCSGLTSITIPNSVTTIEVNNAGSICSGCTSLTSINVESGNTIYDSRNNCNAIIETATNKLVEGCQNTVIPDNVTTIGMGAFYGCSGLTSITIPNGVTSIGNYAFQSCSGLTGITIGSGVTSIGQSAFQNCSGLTSITIPNSITSIGQSAFNGCSGLTGITIGSGVTSIGGDAFASCTSVISITSLATTAPTIQSTTFGTYYGSINTNGTLYVPSGSTGYDVWMGTGDTYLGKLNWTKVEQ